MSTMEASLRKRIDQLNKQLWDLKEFYGSPEHYERQEKPIVITEGQVRISTTEPLVMLDKGKRAREAG